MRLLDRNKRAVLWAPCAVTAMGSDAQGRRNGSRQSVYGPVRELLCHVGAPSGDAAPAAYGARLGYDRALVLESLPEGMDESAGFWLRSDPAAGPDGCPASAPDHAVSRISPSLNVVSVELRETR